MKRTQWFLVLSTVFALTQLTACGGDDGKDGAAGVAGTQGVQGPAGMAGAPAPTSLNVAMVGRFVTPADDPEGAAEIVHYHAATQTIYTMNSSGDVPTLEIIDAANLAEVNNPQVEAGLSSVSLALPTNASGTTLSDANSIAISGDLLAVAMQADAKSDNGAILFYDVATGTPAFIKSVVTGNLPDMVTFTPDGTKALVANEGEPSGDYLTDPEGSISIINIVNGVPADTAQSIVFTGFNGQQAALEARGVRFANPGSSSVAQDLEPEYIAATNDIAFVSLQENNALAVIDLADNSVEVKGLGYKDWSQYLIDVSDKDGINFNQYENLYGMYQPDTIAAMTWKGATFVLTANEGDAREYFFDVENEAACDAAGGIDYDDDDGCLSYIDEARVKDLTLEPTSMLASVYEKNGLGRLKVTQTMGDTDSDGDYDALYAFGARSFSIWDANGLQVFDSGDDFGRITASIHGEAFNNNEDENGGDARSDDKGGEPEALTVGVVGDKTYAFIGLERMGGIFIYDVTNPYDVSFVDYFINRDLTEGLEGNEIAGDLAPEGMVFVKAEDSPTGEALLIVSNEISGSVSVWQVKRQ